MGDKYIGEHRNKNGVESGKVMSHNTIRIGKCCHYSRSGLILNRIDKELMRGFFMIHISLKKGQYENIFRKKISDDELYDYNKSNEENFMLELKSRKIYHREVKEIYNGNEAISRWVLMPDDWDVDSFFELAKSMMIKYHQKDILFYNPDETTIYTICSDGKSETFHKFSEMDENIPPDFISVIENEIKKNKKQFEFSGFGFIGPMMSAGLLINKYGILAYNGGYSEVRQIR